MADIRVDVRKLVDAPTGIVHACLADFTRTHPRLLPDAVRDFRVVTGGFGEGTILACTVRIGGRDRHFTFRVSEPITGKVITAYDHDAQLTVSWHLQDEGSGTRVTLDVLWTELHLRFGPIGVWFTEMHLRRHLTTMLDRLPALIEDAMFETDSPARR